jgi:RNA polymerase sigma factor (sigma-70 family)
MSPRLPIRLLAAQSDRRLVELVEAGHERAFEVLVHRYRRQLLRYCGRLGLSESRAEDALQQSLLRAWMSLQRGTEVRELKPWLYRIVHNTAVNVMRRSREDHAPLPDVAPLALVAATDGELERRSAVREALADVAALPALQRDAILLSAIDGRSHEEVANALGVTHGAVRGLLYRARTTLRGAAAALTPQPLLAWAAGSAGRVAPAASRIAELSGGAGGSEAGGALMKGLAVALTTAAAAGAVVVPLPRDRAHRASSTLADLAGARTGASSVLASSDGHAVAGAVGSGRVLAIVKGSSAAPTRQRASAGRPLSADGREGSALDRRSGSRRGDSTGDGERSDSSLGMEGLARDGGPSASLVQTAAGSDGGRGPAGSPGGDGAQATSSGSGDSSGSGSSSGSGDRSGSDTSSGSGDSSGSGSSSGSGDSSRLGDSSSLDGSSAEREAALLRSP